MDESLGTPQEDLALQIGKLAIERKLISPEQLKEALAEQARDIASGRKQARPLGNILVSRGYLASDQLVALLDHQRLVGSVAAKDKAGPNYPPFGKYQLLRELGRGGMGVVYEAIDGALKRRVALKMMLANPNADPEEARLDEERFLREARLSANLSKHPAIVSVFEAGVIDGKRYLAMEYIDGAPMSKWRKQGSVTIRQQVSLLRDVALAVHHAHEQKIMHRDLKPDNVLIDQEKRPHVTDFGLAKSVGQDVSLSLTASGMVMGTPTHMSPEQARGLKTIDHRTDIYSLGVMLYETLTGRVPFEGETAIEILMKAVNKPVPRPSAVIKAGSNPTLDAAIETICLKCLAKKPSDRYATAEALAADLTRWLKGEEVQVKVASPTQRKTVQGKKSLAWAYAAGGVIAVIAIVLALVISSRPPAADPDVAADAAARARVEEQQKAKGQTDRLNRELEAVKAEVAKAKHEKEELAKREREATSEAERQKAAAQRAKVEERERIAEEEKRKKEEELLTGQTQPAVTPTDVEGPPGEEEWQKAVDLISMVDPKTATVAGSWRLRDGKLDSDGGAPFSRLELPYHPGAEYDFRVIFTPLGNTGDVHQLLTVSGKTFEWLMGGWNNTIFGFQSIAGAAAFANPTTTRASLQQGRQHTSLVQVRRTGIKAYLDGKLLAAWKTNYTDMELPASWKLRDDTALGLGTMGGPTTFARVQVLEVTGKGRVSRPSLPVNPKPVNATPGLGLVGHWKLDDGNGTAATDSSGRGMTGAIEGSPSWVIGKVGGGLAFDGATSVVKVPDAPELQIIGDMTLAFWMRMEATATEWVRIVGKGTSTLRNYGVWLEVPPGSRILFQQHDVSNASLSVNSTTVIEPGKWYHIACTLQGNTGRVFVNGTLESSGIRSRPPPLGSDPLTFGYGGMHSHFHGVLDDIRIYNRALSREEITALVRAAGHPVPESKKVSEAERTIKEMFKADYAKRTPADLQVLAQRLLKRGIAVNDDLDMQFVLLREARDLAAQVGDVSTMLAAAEGMCQTFAMDYFEMATVALATASKGIKTPEAAAKLTEACLAVSERAVDADNYELAVTLLLRGESSAKLSQDVALILRAQLRRKDVEEIRREYGRIQVARKALEVNPGDTQANLAIGRFLCFFKQNWSEGLPLLAKSGDVALSNQAKKELQLPTEPADQVAIGDGWWDIAEKQTTFLKTYLRDRAIDWYERAWPKTSGDIKARLRTRFKTVFSRPSPQAALKTPVAGTVPGWDTDMKNLDGTVAHSGFYSLRISRAPNSDTNNTLEISTPRIPANPAGDQFILSGWFLTENTSATDQLVLRLWDMAGLWLRNSDGPGIPVDQPFWTFVSKRVVVPAGMSFLGVKILATSRGGTIWVDDLSLKRVGEDKELLQNPGFEQR